MTFKKFADAGFLPKDPEVRNALVALVDRGFPAILKAARTTKSDDADVVLLKCFAKALVVLHEVAPLCSQKSTCKSKPSSRQHDALALIPVTASAVEDQAISEVVGLPCKHGLDAMWAVLIAPHRRWIAWAHLGCTILPLLASAIFVAVSMAVIGSLICKPELLVSIPFTLLRAMPSYFEYAANRMWGQLEHEFGLSPSAVMAPSLDQSGDGRALALQATNTPFLFSACGAGMLLLGQRMLPGL